MPPLAESQRILDRVAELQPDIDAYDKAQTKLRTIEQRFPDAMKKSLLQYAIEGKLVPQRKEEGTAKDLLVKIRAEKAQLIKEKKIKKTKPLPAITDDEKPFDIPDSWEWARLVVSRFFRKFISSASKYRHQMYGFSSSAGCSISILNRCSMSI